MKLPIFMQLKALECKLQNLKLALTSSGNSRRTYS